MAKKKVVVGMSGGVDSSVAAYLLKEQGYDVIGVTMQIWQDEESKIQEENGGCCGLSAVDDARKVAAQIGIPYYVMNFKKDFQEKVIDYFVDEYLHGRTPNPCIACNRYVKWESLLTRSMEIGADYIATGHYARMKNGVFMRGIDDNKDQTYFLSQVPKEVLNKTLFPVGDLNKSEVREIAKEYDLITAEKKDSTGICFIGERNITKFLENYLPNIPGDIVNIDSMEKVGTHIGLMYYTIGQRRGLNIGGYENRMFVVGKNLDKNILYVALGEDNEYLYSTSCIVTDINWISDNIYTECTAKFRYRQKDCEVSIERLDGNKALVKFKNKVKAVTKGQACVFYKNEECLGGGIIDEVLKDGKKLWYL